jgi:hypothetical protein
MFIVTYIKTLALFFFLVYLLQVFRWFGGSPIEHLQPADILISLVLVGMFSYIYYLGASFLK